jgi:hypothetical protein
MSNLEGQIEIAGLRRRVAVRAGEGLAMAASLLNSELLVVFSFTFQLSGGQLSLRGSRSHRLPETAEDGICRLVCERLVNRKVGWQNRDCAEFC